MTDSANRAATNTISSQLTADLQAVTLCNGINNESMVQTSFSLKKIEVMEDESSRSNSPEEFFNMDDDFNPYHGDSKYVLIFIQLHFVHIYHLS